jgi:RNA polymerase sigma factor (sigma-70 family)
METTSYLSDAEVQALVSDGISEKDKDVLATNYFSYCMAIGRRIARSFHMKEADTEMVISYACEGLTGALNRYDPQSGVPFKAYLGLCVRSTVGEYLKVYRRRMKRLKDNKIIIRSIKDTDCAPSSDADDRIIYDIMMDGLSEKERVIVDMAAHAIPVRNIAIECSSTYAGVEAAICKAVSGCVA